MMSGDGLECCTHPLYACFVGDYPEEVLLTCTKTMECPECNEHRRSIGDNGPLEEPASNLHDLNALLAALHSFDNNQHGFKKT